MRIPDRIRSHLRRIPFRIRLFIIPALLVFLYLALTVIEQGYINSQYSLIHSVTGRELDTLRKINDFESRLSGVFGRIHSLILSAGRGRDGKMIDEEYVYTHGKPLIYRLHAQKNRLENALIPSLGTKISPSLLLSLQTQFGHYHQHASSAITMVSVDLEQAGRQAADASTYYNRIVRSLGDVKEQLIRQSEKAIDDLLERSRKQTRTVAVLLFAFILLVILVALLFSRQLSEEFGAIAKSIPACMFSKRISSK